MTTTLASLGKLAVVFLPIGIRFARLPNLEMATWDTCMKALLHFSRAIHSGQRAGIRKSLVVRILACCAFTLSQYSSAAKSAELSELTAAIKSNYPGSYLAAADSRATIEEATRFVAALGKVVDEQVRIYSDANSAAEKSAQNGPGPETPEITLYYNLMCQQALPYFAPMLDPDTATIEAAALFWYGSSRCVNSATRPFIRTEQAGGIAYEKVKKAISEVAGGLNPSSYRIQLSNNDLQTLMALANTQIDKPAKERAAAIYSQAAAPQSAVPAVVVAEPPTDVQ